MVPEDWTPHRGAGLPEISGRPNGDSKEHYAEGFNPVHIMANSGANTRYDQMRHISGMRGLMAKPDGSIIERPIFTSLREGLSAIEYFISTHGARKGLADTAIKTASSGYLTRKLVDVSQDVIVTTDDCGTLDGVTKTEMEADEEGSPLSTLLVGRVTAQSIVDPATNEEIVPPNTVIDGEMASRLDGVELLEVTVRSPLTCETIRGVCQMCYGQDLTNHRLVDVGEAIGIIAAQSIGEPSTQLTMRTFHTYGTASDKAGAASLVHARAREGRIVYHNLETTKRANGEVIALRNGTLSIEGPDGRERERRRVPAGSTILVTEGQSVMRDDELFTGAADHVPILTKVKGILRFEDVIPGVTLEELVDDVTGQRERVITDYRENMPRAEILTAADGEVIESYMLPAGARLAVNAGAEVLPGDTLARMPRQAAKTSDIVTGLPRVTELFEARKPTDHATISEITGAISFQGMSRGMQVVRVTPQDAPDNYREYKIPISRFIVVQEGDTLEVGDPLTDGSLNPHDILDVKGRDEVQRYIVKEIKAVYRRQGERINDKHCEVIIRQMMRKVRVTDAGDTNFLEGDEIPLTAFRRENQRVATHPAVHVAKVALETAGDYVGGEVAETIEIDGEVVIEEGGVLSGELLGQLRAAGLDTLHMVFESDSSPAEAAPLLQGITAAALSTESFISAASFQQTTNVLTKAAAMGKRDMLRGLKENVIMGRLIPAGTGLYQLHRATDQLHRVTEEAYRAAGRMVPSQTAGQYLSVERRHVSLAPSEVSPSAARRTRFSRDAEHDITDMEWRCSHRYASWSRYIAARASFEADAGRTLSDSEWMACSTYPTWGEYAERLRKGAFSEALGYDLSSSEWDLARTHDTPAQYETSKRAAFVEQAQNELDDGEWAQARVHTSWDAYGEALRRTTFEEQAQRVIGDGEWDAAREYGSWLMYVRAEELRRRREVFEREAGRPIRDHEWTVASQHGSWDDYTDAQKREEFECAAGRAITGGEWQRARAFSTWSDYSESEKRRLFQAKATWSVDDVEWRAAREFDEWSEYLADKRRRFTREAGTDIPNELWEQAQACASWEQYQTPLRLQFEADAGYAIDDDEWKAASVCLSWADHLADKRLRFECEAARTLSELEWLDAQTHATWAVYNLRCQMAAVQSQIDSCLADRRKALRQITAHQQRLINSERAHSRATQALETAERALSDTDAAVRRWEAALPDGLLRRLLGGLTPRAIAAELAAAQAVHETATRSAEQARRHADDADARHDTMCREMRSMEARRDELDTGMHDQIRHRDELRRTLAENAGTDDSRDPSDQGHGYGMTWS